MTSMATNLSEPTDDNARPAEPVWLDVAGAARRVLVSSATILREVRAGRLLGYRVGGRKCWRFRPADVDSWLMTARTPVSAPPALRPKVSGTVRLPENR